MGFIFRKLIIFHQHTMDFTINAVRQIFIDAVTGCRAARIIRSPWRQISGIRLDSHINNLTFDSGLILAVLLIDDGPLSHRLICQRRRRRCCCLPRCFCGTASGHSGHS